MKIACIAIKMNLLSLFIIFIVACSPEVTPGKIAEKPVLQPASSVQKSLEQEWQVLISAARKEGRVVIFNSGTFVGARQTISRAFKEKYGVDIEFTSGGSAEIAQRNLRERRAGIYAVDIEISGTTTYVQWLFPEGIMDPLEPVLVLPEVREPKAWLGGSLRFFDPQKRALSFAAGVAPQLLINKDLVRPDELRSFSDLLNPKWKGKIDMHYPLEPGVGQQAVSVISSVLGFEALRALAGQEPFITRDHYQLLDWVVKGKYAIAAFIQQSRGTDLENTGAPVKMIVLSDISYMTPSGCVLGLVNKAPHPNAAKLFINWLLSKEGQTLVYRDMGLPSARIDVPTEGISPVIVPDPDKKYFRVDDMEWATGQIERNKQIADIFRPLVQ